MLKQATALSYAVRLRVVLKYLGQLSFVLVALTLVPFGASLLFGETDVTLRYAIVMIGLAIIGACLARLPLPSRVQANEGMVLVALMFVFTPVVMTYPMMASGLSFVDALFEAISGSTTTGLSTLSSVENTPQTFRFARAWMQWYGGLGIMVFSLALVSQPSMVTEGLGVTEAESDDLVGSTKAHLRRVLAVYGILSGFGILVLSLLGVAPFDAILYTFSALSTGGFAPHNDSLAGLSGWLPAVIVTLICLLGAISFTLYHRAYKEKGFGSLSLMEPVAILLCSGLLTVVLATCFRVYSAMPWAQALYHAPLVALSAQSTAGFSTLNLADLDAIAKLAMIPVMAIGGAVGSTAGGFKMLRLLIMLRLLQVVIVRTSLPKQAVLDTRLEQRRLGDREIHDALLLILLFITVVVLSWLPFVAMGYDPLDALFEVVSATGTVGLSVGITSTELPLLLKSILCVDMLLGRLELIAWLVLLYPGTWLGRRRVES